MFLPQTRFDVAAVDGDDRRRGFPREREKQIHERNHRQHMPAAYVNVPEFEEILPVRFQAHKFSVDSPGSPLAWQPQLTPAGLRTEWLTLADAADENLKKWKEMPGIFWHYPITKLRPGAIPLLVHPTAKMGDEMRNSIWIE